MIPIPVKGRKSKMFQSVAGCCPCLCHSVRLCWRSREAFHAPVFRRPHRSPVRTRAGKSARHRMAGRVPWHMSGRQQLFCWHRHTARGCDDMRQGQALRDNTDGHGRPFEDWLRRAFSGLRRQQGQPVSDLSGLMLPEPVRGLFRRLRLPSSAPAAHTLPSGRSRNW